MVVWISILGGVTRRLAPEQKVWSDEVGGPRCVDGIKIVVCRDGIDVRI